MGPRFYQPQAGLNTPIQGEFGESKGFKRLWLCWIQMPKSLSYQTWGRKRPSDPANSAYAWLTVGKEI